MNLLPWLLDWPPSRGTIAVFVVLTVFSVGTLIAFGGVTDEITDGNVSIESADLSVTLNDEVNIPDTNGSVQTCLGSGTPGDSIAVMGDVTVDIPVQEQRDRNPERIHSIVVSLAHTNESTSTAVERTGQVTQDVSWILDDDESLAPGETARLQIRVRTAETVVNETTQRVTVKNGSRSYDC